jgi:CRISPR type III-A-associated protein Csm2
MNTQNQSIQYPKVKLKNHPEWITEQITDETIKWCKYFGEFLAKSIEIDLKKYDELKCKTIGDYLLAESNSKNVTIGPLTSSQLRKFFGAIKRIHIFGEYSSSNYHQLLRLKPLLAYAVGRDMKEDSYEKKKIIRPSSKIIDFYEEISSAIDIMKGQDKNAFNNFVQIVEAIVAYHKAAGGK